MMQERLLARPIPVQIPWGSAEDFRGVVDIVRMEAFEWEDDGANASGRTTEIPPELLAAVTSARETVLEAACEVDDDLLARYLASEPLETDRIAAAVRKGTCDLRFTPVLCGAAFKNKGVQPLLDAVVSYLPSPVDVPPIEGKKPGTDETVVRKAADDQPFAALVFKITTDPFVGHLAYLRVYSGHLSTGDSVFTPARSRRERVGRLLKMHANKREEIHELWAGDIAAAVGLRSVSTGDTVCDEKNPVLLESMDFPEPVIRLAIEPKTKADQEKLGSALGKLVQEDPTFRVNTDSETGQTLIAGMGELHLEILVDRLQREFGVSANVGKPQVAYRETVKGPAEAEGRWIRQTGGRGQYGHVKIRIAPSAREAGFVFENAIVGGAIPKEFIGACEAGLKEAMDGGVLCGFPMKDIKVSLYDGSYHEVDSSEMAFKTAASIAFKEAARRAGLALLEPVMRVEVVVPEEYMGEVIGDLNARRGRIQSMEPRAGVQVIVALVPLAEVFGYATDLRSRTQGRGTYTMLFDRHEEVPKALAEEVVARIEGISRR
jgi:elongation factor G